MHLKYAEEERTATFWSKVNLNGPTLPHMETCCWASLYVLPKSRPQNWHKKDVGETLQRGSEPSSSPIWRLRSRPYQAGMKNVERKVRVRVYILARGSPISMWERTHPRTPAPDPDRSLVLRPLPAKEVVNSPEGVGVIARIGPMPRAETSSRTGEEGLP